MLTGRFLRPCIIVGIVRLKTTGRKSCPKVSECSLQQSFFKEKLWQYVNTFDSTLANFDPGVTGPLSNEVYLLETERKKCLCYLSTESHYPLESLDSDHVKAQICGVSLAADYSKTCGIILWQIPPPHTRNIYLLSSYWQFSCIIIPCKSSAISCVLLRIQWRHLYKSCW